MLFERDRHRLISTSQTNNIGSRRLLIQDIRQKYCGKLTGRWMFRILKVLCVSMILGYFTWSFVHRPQVILDKNYGETDGTNSEITKIETQCSQSSSTCYSVVDIVNRETSVVQRATYVNGFEKEYDTVVQLIPPQGMTFESSDTRMWAINHTVLTTQYVAAMITQLFTTSALPLESIDDDKREILVIGLGGGNFDMFLHIKRPKIRITVAELEPVVVDLAKRWFGVVEDETRKTLIKDGLAAINDAKTQGIKYDVVVLDACDNTKELPCPSKSFLSTEALTNIRSILKPMGTFIINVLPLDNQKINIEMVLKTLLHHFPVCIKMQMSYEANIVFSCLPYSLAADNLEDTKRLILQRAERASMDLGIHGVLEYLDLTVVS